MTYLIFIYSDYGSSEMSVRQLDQTLRDLYPWSKVLMLTGKDIRDGKLMQHVEIDTRRKLLCIGGGFDLGYVESLGEHGCDEIRRFVSEGGNYLGICAGAYFACSMVNFDLNGPLEVVGERRMKFFKGSAIGPCNIRYFDILKLSLFSILLSRPNKLLENMLLRN